MVICQALDMQNKGYFPHPRTISSDDGYGELLGEFGFERKYSLRPESLEDDFTQEQGMYRPLMLGLSQRPDFVLNVTLEAVNPYSLDMKAVASLKERIIELNSVE